MDQSFWTAGWTSVMALLGGSGPPHYCTFICVRFWYTSCASCLDLINKKNKQKKTIPVKHPNFSYPHQNPCIVRSMCLLRPWEWQIKRICSPKGPVACWGPLVLNTYHPTQSKSKSNKHSLPKQCHHPYVHMNTMSTLETNLSILYPALTLSPLPRGTDKEMLTQLFFFLFSSSVSRYRALSCRPRRTLPLQVKGGGSKGDTLMAHQSLLYRAQYSSWHVALQSHPVDGDTSLHHHSHLHAGSLGTTRSSDLREIICAPTAEHEWLVRRGPGIGYHIGRRHLKGLGPNKTWQ